MRTAFRCRAYPTPEQAAVLSRTFGCVRLVWNKTLAERQARYRTGGGATAYRETDAALTGWKKTDELGFLGEVSSVPLQQVLRHQHVAFNNFFAGRARRPRFKSRRGRQSAHYTRSAFRMRDGKLWLAKTSAPLELVWSWPAVDLNTVNPTTVIVSREPDGRWYVTLAADVAEPASAPETCREVGIDLGITTFATTSAGQEIANPRYLERRARRLARYQRYMSRCRPGSRNREKARKKVAAAHRKVRNARRDFLHRVSTNLVRDHDLAAIEDLAVKNMVRNRSLARAISDVAWREFRAMLEYKSARAGRTLAVVDRWYPSSKTCSSCGHVLAQLALSTRSWTCQICRARHDRDVNAAKNILAAGRAVTRSPISSEACGADVRRRGRPSSRSAVKRETRIVRCGASSTARC
ncbi:RNA-guided endonuclease InsQ/TnpB family protein [Lentzea sp. CA-135723]|uniref:RNA-guided endonuclease InsQ/TnpB family protein n=1 Tax=Lentzea sp. CA-135723 TaxID=3239950 RepID=UPI003D8A0B96